MKWFRRWIAIAAWVACSTASGADPQGRFAVRGAGFATCEHYLRAHELKSNEWHVFYGWFDGYLSGLNEKTSNVFDIAPWQSTELIAEVLRNACSRNPSQYVLPLIRAVVAGLAEHQLEQADDKISVEVGKQNTLIYPSTLLRVQKQLMRRGYATEQPSGQFNVSTQAAIEAFQAKHGLPVTGLPGPVTLWALLVEELE